MPARSGRARGCALEDEVIVTAVIPYGDADAVVRLFGRHQGRIGAFARHARASRRRFPGLSAPAIGTASLLLKNGAELHALQELDLHPTLLPLAGDLRAWGHAAYLVELVERLLPEAEPAPDVFALVHEALCIIARAGPSATLLRAVELRLLRALGYLPDLSDPDAAGLDMPEDARIAALALLRAELLSDLPGVSSDVLRQVARPFAAHLRQLGGAPLKSVQFLGSLEGASLASPARSR